AGEPEEEHVDEDAGPVSVPIVGATSAADAQSDAAAYADAEERSQRLLEVLHSVELAVLPSQPRRHVADPADPAERHSRGDWLEVESRDGGQRYMEVAWINRKRPVALLVRHPDRRALSLRMNEMARRFAAGRAFLLERAAH